MCEDVRDENNIVIGQIQYSDTGNTITYYSWKHGTVGTFDVVGRQYHRLKTYPGGGTYTWNGQDWGVTDLLYWAKH